MCQSVFWSVNVLGGGHRWVGGELVMSRHTCPPIWANLLQLVSGAITLVMTISLAGGRVPHFNLVYLVSPTSKKRLGWLDGRVLRRSSYHV